MFFVWTNNFRAEMRRGKLCNDTQSQTWCNSWRKEIIRKNLGMNELYLLCTLTWGKFFIRVMRSFFRNLGSFIRRRYLATNSLSSPLIINKLLWVNFWSWFTEVFDTMTSPNLKVLISVEQVSLLMIIFYSKNFQTILHNFLSRFLLQ